MKTKLIKIKDLRAGMQIKSYDQTTHEVVYKEVTDVWKTEVPTEDQRHLFFTNSTDLKCSKNHPIMVLEQGGVVKQVLPDDLLPEHQVISEYGITTIARVEVGNRKTQHIDITVEDSHVFFASSGLDDEQILTHNSQGGVRGGAATLYYPIWHLEVEDMLVLKNNKGTEDNRVRHMDYGVQFNKLMYERLLTGGDITLFSPHDVPGLYDSFFNDQVRFKELYETAERNTHLRKKTVSAVELFSAFVTERKDTGRIYLMNVDHANTHGSFIETVAPIRMSNLCCLTGDTMVSIMENGKIQHNVMLSNVVDLVNQGREIFVLSKNINDDSIQFKSITAAMLTRKNAELVLIEDEETGQSIKCTPDHEIYTKNRGYVRADLLKEDDILDINSK